MMEALNFDKLVELRFKHQRMQAETGVRKWHTETSTSNSSQGSELDDFEDQDNHGRTSEVKEATSLTRKKILQEYNSIIKSLEERGVSTSVGRTLRWQPGHNPKPVESGTTTVTGGNSVNAQEMARKQSSAVNFDSVLRNSTIIIDIFPI
jgi:hypothetical protein